MEKRNGKVCNESKEGSRQTNSQKGGNERRKEEETKETNAQKKNKQTDGFCRGEKEKKNSSCKSNTCYGSQRFGQNRTGSKKVAKGSNGNAYGQRACPSPKKVQKSHVSTRQLQRKLEISSACIRQLKERLLKITDVLSNIEEKHGSKRDQEEQKKSVKSVKRPKKCGKLSSLPHEQILSPSSSISSLLSGLDDEFERGREMDNGKGMSMYIPSSIPSKTIPTNASDDFLYKPQQVNNSYYYDTLSPEPEVATTSLGGREGKEEQRDSVTVQKTCSPLQNLYSDFSSLSEFSDFTSVSGEGRRT